MSEIKTAQIEKLNKLREAWLPVVEFLFGDASADVAFQGFDVSHDIAKPLIVLNEEKQQRSYQIQIPARSFTNEVMLLADLMQAMVSALYPSQSESSVSNVLAEGVAMYGAVTAVNRVFGEETLASYINALEQNAFSYYDAFNYAADILASDPQVIKKLRHVQPDLNRVTKEDFANAEVDVERKIQDVLLFTFRE